jgi:hypothetical protein
VWIVAIVTSITFFSMAMTFVVLALYLVRPQRLRFQLNCRVFALGLEMESREPPQGTSAAVPEGQSRSGQTARESIDSGLPAPASEPRHRRRKRTRLGDGGLQHRHQGRPGPRAATVQRLDKSRTRQRPDVRALCALAVSGKVVVAWGGRAAPLRLKRS